MNLRSDGHFLPVALGGLSIEEYTSIAPPDSFIHVYNFSSIHQLGIYLKYLMVENEAYNRYHKWREHFFITRNRFPQSSVCDLCKIANIPEILASSKHKSPADEFNDPHNCKRLPINFDVTRK